MPGIEPGQLNKKVTAATAAATAYISMKWKHLTTKQIAICMVVKKRHVLVPHTPQIKVILFSSAWQWIKVWQSQTKKSNAYNIYFMSKKNEVSSSKTLMKTPPPPPYNYVDIHLEI